MLFNSIDFALFLPVVFILYWIVAKQDFRRQNILLLVASYFFYACWDYRFLGLLFFSTALDFFTGRKIYEAGDPSRKKYWLWLSIGINLGFLGFFKYYNFFVSSFAGGLALIGLEPHITTLEIILPVGISFYTFHGLSYLFDIYNNRIKPENNFIDYAVFVSFFPLLVAGPIERATHLLPQLKKKRVFGYARSVDGLKQILWGLFKKIVIADGCAGYVNMVFDNPGAYPGSTLVVAAVLFAFQIYGDFSGYSDIALGTARLFGIDLLRNFAYPYFSRDMAEFWRRWHISLATWFRDYLYIPLGGNRDGTRLSVRNTFVIFLVSGFWHGANWTFIAWGLLNALYMMPAVLTKTNRRHLDIVAAGKLLPSFGEIVLIGRTFGLAVLAWILFRAESIGQAFTYYSGIFSSSFFTVPQKIPDNIAGLITFFVAIEWMGRERSYALAGFVSGWPKPMRWIFYYILLVSIFFFAGTGKTFIYFQF